MFAVIDLPDFPLQSALRFEPELRDSPVALIDPEQPRSPVIQANATARAHGIIPGLTPTQAAARCPSVRLKPRTPSQETLATQALLQCVYAFSPRMETTAPGICTVDLRGLPILSPRGTHSARLDLLEQWGTRLADELDRSQLDARVGLASHPLLALYAARSGSRVLAVGNETQFVRGLPLPALTPPDEVMSILQKWGIRTVGDFLALGKKAIADRLGAAGLDLFERAVPRKLRPLRLIEPPETFEEEFEFEHEVDSLQPLLFTFRRFLEQLTHRLELSGWAAERLTLRLRFTDGPDHERTFCIPSPTSAIDTLFRVLDTHLETLRAEHPVCAVALSIQPCHPPAQQLGLFETALRNPNRFYEMLGRLDALVGPGRAGTPQNEPSHRPDHFRMDPPQFDRRTPTALRDRKPAAETPVETPAFGLPLSRFRPPMPARVELRGGRPVHLRSSMFTGKILAAAGPWRLSGEWWDNQAWHRTEWDIETAEHMLLRLVEENHRWFVEGIYD